MQACACCLQEIWGNSSVVTVYWVHLYRLMECSKVSVQGFQNFQRDFDSALLCVVTVQAKVLGRPFGAIFCNEASPQQKHVLGCSAAG